MISSLGSAGAAIPDVAEQGTTHITTAMRARGVDRLISVTGTGAALRGETITGNHAAKRAQMRAVAPPPR